MTLKNYRVVALAVAQPGREMELEKWYDAQHIPDALRLDGFVSAQRFKILNPPDSAVAQGWTTMVIYDLETADFHATLGQIEAVINTPAMPMTEALDMSRFVTLRVAEATPKFTKATS